MKCAECPKPITSADAKNPKKVVAEYDAQGRLLKLMHLRCANHKRKMENPVRVERMAVAPDAYRMAQGQGRQNRDDLTPEALDAKRRQEEAYSALRHRQTEIAEQRDLEPTPGGEDDWRDPVTLDLEDVISRSREDTADGGEST